jgi:N-acetylneuraminic acid mutarotase
MKLLAPLAMLLSAIPGMSASAALSPASPATVSSLAALPDAFGFAGMFAGVSGTNLLCAGGANFPEKPLAEGGRKIWHDRVFALATAGGAWREVGRLPRPNAYGVSATWRGSLVLAGGGDARINFHSACLLRWDGLRLVTEDLPPLPVSTANACGTVVGDILYVAGGQETPASTAALQRCFALDLAAPVRSWKEIPWPDSAPGRILAVAAALDGWFYIFSGADLLPTASGTAGRRYLTDAWRYRPASGWQRLAELPHAVVAAPSPAINAPGELLAIVGGVSPEYLASLPQNGPHPGFARQLLLYRPATNTWTVAAVEMGAVPPRVTAPLTSWGNRFVIPSGEVAPGIRTPTVLTLSFTP